MKENNEIEKFEEDIYEKVKKELEEKGYETLKKEKIDELIKLFKEMLEYKNKEYDENWNLKDWIDKIDTNYHYFHDILKDTLNIVFWKIDIYAKDDEESKVSPVMEIVAIVDLYNELSNKENGYKEYADYYKEIELKDGQTYEDLYNLEIKKFIKLFQEMLNFVNAKYNGDDFDQLSAKVSLEYPYYSDLIIHLDSVRWSVDGTYISIIYSMRRIYEKLSENYKNHEQNMKEYQETLERIEKMDEQFYFFG